MMPLGAFCIKLTSRVPVAQLDRVVAFEANGCGFESLPGRQQHLRMCLVISHQAFFCCVMSFY